MLLNLKQSLKNAKVYVWVHILWEKTYQTLSPGTHRKWVWIAATGPIMHHLVHKHDLSCFLWLTAQFTLAGLWKNTNTHTQTHITLVQLSIISDKDISGTQRTDNTHLTPICMQVAVPVNIICPLVALQETLKLTSERESQLCFTLYRLTIWVLVW